MPRNLFIAACPRLLSALEEQIDALAGHKPHAIADTDAFTIPPEDSDAAAVLLDADSCDASDFARRLRAQGFTGRIIVIGAPCADADAALSRPFRLAALAAHLLAGTRTIGAAAAPGVRLTEKEAAILARLEQACGAILSKESLLADIWGYGPNVTTRTLETHIHRLRRKIEQNPSLPRKLLTDGDGYRLAKNDR